MVTGAVVVLRQMDADMLVGTVHATTTPQYLWYETEIFEKRASVSEKKGTPCERQVLAPAGTLRRSVPSKGPPEIQG